LKNCTDSLSARRKKWLVPRQRRLPRVHPVSVTPKTTLKRDLRWTSDGEKISRMVADHPRENASCRGGKGYHHIGKGTDSQAQAQGTCFARGPLASGTGRKVKSRRGGIFPSIYGEPSKRKSRKGAKAEKEKACGIDAHYLNPWSGIRAQEGNARKRGVKGFIPCEN